tara:strand:+ start:87 stop:1064 length:978 start_codon:yes stop_codon:yes gene_type:complete
MNILNEINEIFKIKDNMNQGKMFNRNKQKYVLKEGLSGYKGIDDLYKTKDDDLNRLNIEYKEKMEKYLSKYKLLIDSISENESGSNFRGEIVNFKGVHYFVDNNNIKRKIVYESRDESCPNVAKDINESDFEKLRQGIDMRNGEICKTGGYNARYSGETAWIDVNGKKHIYANFATKHSSCPEEVNEVTESQWKSYDKSSEQWEIMDSCNYYLSEGTNNLYNEVMVLNEDLNNLVKRIYDLTEERKEEAKNLDPKITQEKDKIKMEVDSLEKQKKVLEKHYSDLNSYKRNKVEYDMLSSSNRMKYMLYGLGSVLAIMAIIRSSIN